MKIAEIFARVRLKADVAKVAKYTAGVLALTAAMKSMLKTSMDTAAALKQFEAETGASTESLQRWQGVGARMNIAASSITKTVKYIADNQERIKLGMGNIVGYGMTNLPADKDPFTFLNALRKEMSMLSPAMKKVAYDMMGVSSDMIRMLNLSQKEFDELAAQSPYLTQRMIDGLERTKGSLNNMWNGIKWLGAVLATDLAPAIEEFSNALFKFIRKDGRNFVAALVIIIKTIARILTLIIKVVGWFLKWTDAIIGVEGALMILIGAIALMNAAWLTSPIGLITAGFVALLLILEDLYYFATGKGKSLTGVLVALYEKWSGESGPFKDLFLAFSLLPKTAEALANIEKRFGKIAKYATIIKDKVSSFLLGINPLFGIAKAGKNFIDTVSGKRVPPGVKAAQWMANKTYNVVNNITVNKAEDITKEVRDVQKSLSDVYDANKLLYDGVGGN